jgi:hypothetical protein
MLLNILSNLFLQATFVLDYVSVNSLNQANDL